MKSKHDAKKASCDLIIERATTMMQDEVHASVGMILDRLLTFSAAQACLSDGPDAAAAAFRAIADKIDAGALNKIYRQAAHS